MVLSNFRELMQLIGSTFQSFITRLDNVYLFGNFSILEFIIAIFVIDIVITSFFVTYTVGVGMSDVYEYSSKSGEVKHYKKPTAKGSFTGGKR